MEGGDGHDAKAFTPTGGTPARLANVSTGTWGGRGWLLVVAVSGRPYGSGTANDDVGCERVAGAEASTAGGADKGVGDIVTVEGGARSVAGLVAGGCCCTW